MAIADCPSCHEHKKPSCPRCLLERSVKLVQEIWLLLREHTWELADVIENFEDDSLEKRFRMHVRPCDGLVRPYSRFPGTAEWSGKPEDRMAALSFDMCELVLTQVYDMLMALINGKILVSECPTLKEYRECR